MDQKTQNLRGQDPNTDRVFQAPERILMYRELSEDSLSD